MAIGIGVEVEVVSVDVVNLVDVSNIESDDIVVVVGNVGVVVCEVGVEVVVGVD